jgi:hypothetical protein
MPMASYFLAFNVEKFQSLAIGSMLTDPPVVAQQILIEMCATHGGARIQHTALRSHKQMTEKTFDVTLRFTRFNDRVTLVSVFESEDEAFGVGHLRFKVQGFPTGFSVAD